MPGALAAVAGNLVGGIARSRLLQAAASAACSLGLQQGRGHTLQQRRHESHAANTNTFIREALVHLDYPAKLQQLLLTSNRELCVELVSRAFWHSLSLRYVMCSC